MKTNEIVHESMSLGQFRELTATAVGFVPDGLTSSEAQLLIENKTGLNIEGHRSFFNSLYKMDRLFPIVVDYRLSFAEMVDMGGYGECWPDVSEDNFPIEGNGVHRRTIRLFKEISGFANIPKQIKQADARSAKIEELLALGAQYPHLQRYFTVFALGSERDALSEHLRNETVTPILDYLRSCRRLALCESGIRSACQNRVYASIVGIV